MTVIGDKVDNPEANIIFGAVIDETLEEDIVITVIATGFEAEGGNTEITTSQPVAKAAPKENIIQEEVAATTTAAEPIISKDPYEADDLDIPVFLKKTEETLRMIFKDAVLITVSFYTIFIKFYKNDYFVLNELRWFKFKNVIEKAKCK